MQSRGVSLRRLASLPILRAARGHTYRAPLRCSAFGQELQDNQSAYLSITSPGSSSASLKQSRTNRCCHLTVTAMRPAAQLQRAVAQPAALATAARQLPRAKPCAEQFARQGCRAQCPAGFRDCRPPATARAPPPARLRPLDRLKLRGVHPDVPLRSRSDARRLMTAPGDVALPRATGFSAALPGAASPPLGPAAAFGAGSGE